jgi:hypothetical protein
VFLSSRAHACVEFSLLDAVARRCSSWRSASNAPATATTGSAPTTGSSGNAEATRAPTVRPSAFIAPATSSWSRVRRPNASAAGHSPTTTRPPPRRTSSAYATWNGTWYATQAPVASATMLLDSYLRLTWKLARFIACFALLCFFDWGRTTLAGDAFKFEARLETAKHSLLSCFRCRTSMHLSASVRCMYHTSHDFYKHTPWMDKTPAVQPPRHAYSMCVEAKDKTSLASLPCNSL